MVRRVFGNQHHAPDGACRVGMLLEGGIPEILGKVLLTDGKADGWRFGVARERKRETNLGWGAVWPLALALEMHGIRDPDRRRAKAGRVGGGLEIAHGMDDVVEAAGHRRHFTAENAVGCRNMFLIEATIGPSRSLSARLASHSGSVANLFHFVSRSARDSQASR